MTKAGIFKIRRKINPLLRILKLEVKLPKEKKNINLI